MKHIIYIFAGLILFLFFPVPKPFAQSKLTADQIIKKVDENMSSRNRVVESSMVIRGKRRDRTITSKSYSVGTKQ
ncbi:MAG: outer membrane lipoprotein-sorting protein, partial [Bacteroidetes bacterium]|nr:outer membrane lipoprotein-sorting protein [Bacteroidota bacterium]